MTTNGDMSPHRPDEHDPLEPVPDDALDRVDETVAKITDATVEEYLRRVLNESGYGDPAPDLWRDLNPDRMPMVVDFDLCASIDGTCVDFGHRAAAEILTAARLEAELSRQGLEAARQQAERILSGAREEADAALEQAAAMTREAREQAEQIVSKAHTKAEQIITAARNQHPPLAPVRDVSGSMETLPPPPISRLAAVLFASGAAVARDRLAASESEGLWIAEWTTRAACKGTDPDELFVQGGAQHRAKLICRGCPVRTECLADALDNGIEFGVWGGMTERERRALLRRRPDVTSWRVLLEQARRLYEQDSQEVTPLSEMRLPQ